MAKRPVLFVVLATAVCSLAVSQSAAAQAVDMQCLNDALTNADDSTTAGELRALCRERPSEARPAPAAKAGPVYEQSLMAERLANEEADNDQPFMITTHQPGYFLWSMVDEPNIGPYLPLDPNVKLDDKEVMFQLSIKAPFRETNYEPELFMRKVAGARSAVSVSWAGTSASITSPMAVQNPSRVAGIA